MPKRVLVTGATGYVGSRLVPELLGRGHEVVAATRSVGSVERFPWHNQVEPRILDITETDSVHAAVHGCEVVVYLIHAMDSDDFAKKDRAAAERTANACSDAAVEQIIYLSGLAPPGELSEHLASRQEVEEVFLNSNIPATVLRAAMIIGAGSTSFELLRRLSQRVPLLTPVPVWMRKRVQPIAVVDVVNLIAAAIEKPAQNRAYDIGGPQVVTYPDLLTMFADVASLRRKQVMVPWVPNWLVGRACALISGLDIRTVTSLVESLSSDMVCRHDAVPSDLLHPGYRFLNITEALSRSLDGSRVPGTSRQGDVQSDADTDPA